MSGIFISYRREGGYGVANHLVDRLKRDGYKTIIDKEYKEGDFHVQITDSIRECDDFVLVLSSTVFKVSHEGSPYEIDWVREELKQAKEYGKNIIPVMLSGFEWPKELPSDIGFVKTINSIRYDKEDVFDEFYNKLLVFLKTSRPIKLNTKNFVQDNKIWLGILLLTAISIAIYSYINKPNEPVVLVAGGGSVSGSITEKNATAMDGVIYLPIASSAAWSFVSEEINVKNNLDQGKPRQYYVVLLSAWKAKDDDFISDSLRKNEFLKDIGVVIGVKIGSSNLKLVLKNDEYFHKYLGADSLITPKVLADIVKDPNVIVYTTSNKKRGLSGTYLKYKEVLEPYVNLDAIKCNEYNLKQNFGDFNNGDNHFIVLASETFDVNIESNTTFWFQLPFFNIDTIQSDSVRYIKSTIANDLYIYFVAEKDGSRYKVPEQVRNFVTRDSIFPKLPSNEKLGIKDHTKLIQEYTQDGHLK